MDSPRPDINHESIDGRLTVTVDGLVRIADLTRYTTIHQDDWANHDLVLWDLRKVDPSQISSDDILNIDHSFAELIELRSGGRSAIMIGKDLETITKVSIALFEAREPRIKFKAFLDERSAIAWLIQTQVIPDQLV